ncbi:unnamed protein product [Caenorhabditis sp. 36 PRJEB53466]|nr:unnamed protein product [Caenorhabditis sp. 36 PRJEB53466]
MNMEYEHLLKEEDFEDHTDPIVKPYRKYSFRIERVEKAFPQYLLLFLVLMVVIFLTGQYRISMQKLTSRECSDVLADCDGIPFNETIVPPYFDYLQDFTIARQYSLSLCLIPKVMSTIATGTFCYLDDPAAFAAANRTIATEHYKRRFCAENEMKSFGMVRHALKENVSNIIVVRDPFDRFISGFTEKCVRSVDKDFCHGCGTDIRCFLRKEYRRLMRMTMLFPVYSLADTHFAPQTWFCDMKNTLQDSTLIKYSNSGDERTRMIDDFSRVFQKNGVPEEEIEEVRKELGKGKSHHSTAGSELRMKYEKLLREDVAIRRAILRMYYYDFVILGYRM